MKLDCFLSLKTRKALENQGLEYISEVLATPNEVMLRIVMLLPMVAVM